MAKTNSNQNSRYSNQHEQEAHTRVRKAAVYDSRSELQKERPGSANQEKAQTPPAKSETRRLFNKVDYEYTEERPKQIQEVRELLQQIRKEVSVLQQKSTVLKSEVERVGNATLHTTPEQVGEYHINYFEMVLKYIRNLSAKISEAGTWLMAAKGKENKRGSAFAARKKKSGAEYDQSPELQLARATG